MKIVLRQIENLRKKFKDYFIAEDKEPKLVRTKHLRLGSLVTLAFLVCCYLIQNSSNKLRNIKFLERDSMKAKELREKELKEKIKTSSALDSLASGTKNELLWTEVEGKEIDELKLKQETNETNLKAINEKLSAEKVNKQDVNSMMAELEVKMEAKYKQTLLQEVERLKLELKSLEENKQLRALNQRLENKSIKPNKQNLKLGEYIPANSYVQAKLISGVDAGVGMSAESNPRSALLRITGEVVSAGFGGKYLKTDKLIGCQMSLKAVGDISSEKVYLDGVLMSCAKDEKSFMEIPVKAYVSSMGKTGVRGEVVSREGDMVLKSFVAGISSGFSNGVSEFSRPQNSLLDSNQQSDSHRLKSLLSGGLGAGVSRSSNSLAEFFIKRAEQYQPVISVNEGTEVNIIFIEGFSLNGDERNEKAK